VRAEAIQFAPQTFLVTMLKGKQAERGGNGDSHARSGDRRAQGPPPETAQG